MNDQTDSAVITPSIWQKLLIFFLLTIVVFIVSFQAPVVQTFAKNLVQVYIFPRESDNDKNNDDNYIVINYTHRINITSDIDLNDTTMRLLNLSRVYLDPQTAYTMKNQTKTVAVFHYGVLRVSNSSEVHSSHEKYIFKPLRENGYTIYRFLHTWTQREDTYVWNEKIKKADIKTELGLFHPPLTAYSIHDSQEDFIKSVNFSLYFNQRLYEELGDNGKGEWHPYLVRNLLWGMQSLKRAAHLAAYLEVMNNRSFDLVFCMRPDTIVKQFNLNDFLQNIVPKQPHVKVYTPGYSKGEGANDQFSIVVGSMAYALPLYERYDSLLEYRKTLGRVVSEKVMRYQLEKYYPKACGELFYRHALVGRKGKRFLRRTLIKRKVGRY